MNSSHDGTSDPPLVVAAEGGTLSIAAAIPIYNYIVTSYIILIPARPHAACRMHLRVNFRKFVYD